MITAHRLREDGGAAGLTKSQVNLDGTCGVSVNHRTPAPAGMQRYIDGKAHEGCLGAAALGNGKPYPYAQQNAPILEAALTARLSCFPVGDHDINGVDSNRNAGQKS